MDVVDDLESRVRKLEKGQCQRQTCPPSYVKHSLSCLQFVMGRENAKNWTGARRACQAAGANLVTINTKSKETFIARYIKNNFGQRHPVDLYTGLIYTNAEARDPYILDPILGSSTGDSLRWTATKEAVGAARWSPDKIQGDKEGPNLIRQSCVIIRWTPDTKSKLIWRYHVCRYSELAYICEIRLKRQKCGRRRSKKRMKRHAALMYEETGQELDDEDDISDLDFEDPQNSEDTENNGSDNDDDID